MLVLAAVLVGVRLVVMVLVVVIVLVVVVVESNEEVSTWFTNSISVPNFAHKRESEFIFAMWRSVHHVLLFTGYIFLGHHTLWLFCIVYSR